MSALVIRKATNDQIELMVKARIDYCLRNNTATDSATEAKFRKSVHDWTVTHTQREDYLAYFGYLGAELVCFAGLLLVDMPPILEHHNRKQGHVLSFFTYPLHRRKGYGKKLMEHIQYDAKAIGLAKLTLTATDDGLPLYRKTGFCEPVMPYLELRS